MILDDHGNNLDSFRISLESFRSFRVPLLHKPVTGQELFLAVSYSKPALVHFICQVRIKSISTHSVPSHFKSAVFKTEKYCQKNKTALFLFKLTSVCFLAWTSVSSENLKVLKCLNKVLMLLTCAGKSMQKLLNKIYVHPTRNWVCTY